jgi:hypothetical protein
MAIKQAPPFVTPALKAHKALIPKVNQDKRLLITIILEA